MPTVGLRRRRVLVLGIPLWVGLPPQERVALLGHELGHFVNGDPTRGLLTQSAFTTLGHLAYLTSPDRDTDGIAEWITVLLLGFVSTLFQTGHVLLCILGFRDKQRAEYLADQVGARVAGSAGAASVLDALVSRTSLLVGVRGAARTGAPTDEWHDAATAQRGGGLDSLVARRQLSIRDEVSLFASHPPLGLRVRMIGSRPPQYPAVTMTEPEMRRIDAELADWYEAARRDVLEIY